MSNNIPKEVRTFSSLTELVTTGYHPKDPAILKVSDTKYVLHDRSYWPQPSRNRPKIINRFSSLSELHGAGYTKQHDCIHQVTEHKQIEDEKLIWRDVKRVFWLLYNRPLDKL